LQQQRKNNSHLLNETNGSVIKKGDAETSSNYMQVRKYEERQLELLAELEEVEFTLREFLSFMEGNSWATKRRMMQVNRRLHSFLVRRWSH
jgi:hypothetical protein